jgi:ABC-type dipeptide/oligopeptide/nickel transport system permease subunit
LTEIGARPGPNEAFRRATGAGGPPIEPVDSGEPAGPEREFTVEARSQGRIIVRRFFHHKLAIISLVVLLVIVLWAFVGPFLWKWDYNQRTGALSQPPSWDHPFGTDSLGYDMFVRNMRGAQKSLMIAFVVAFLSTTIGVTIGAIAGFYRGKLDVVLMRFVDLLLTIPTIAIAATLGRQIRGGSWWLLAIILAVLVWTSISRVVRGEFLSLREKEFVEAARAIGANDRRIIFKHMLPNVVGSIIVNATLVVAAAILLETALSYLGLGVKSPDTSLGLIISEYTAAFQTRPWLFWFPGLIILTIALTVNFIGDGLRDAFDPKQTRVRA